MSDPPGSGAEACDDCVRRAWLLGRLAGHLDPVRGRIQAVLDLGDEALIGAVAGRDEAAVRDEYGACDPDGYRTAGAAAGLALICRCDPGYPPSLHALGDQPPMLHVAGSASRLLELTRGPAVAVVGARRASPYALEVAASLARGLGRAGVTVVSGMALGVDSAAHEGALDAGRRTIAVLPSAPQRPYPVARRRLHERILDTACVVSELGPDVAARRWMFPARNRIIAALAQMTVVVAARRGSGALLTAQLARELGGEVGAVPGQVTAPLSWGPHRLLSEGAHLVAGPGDVLARLHHVGAGTPAEPSRAVVPADLQPLFDALADGHDPPAAFREAGLHPDAGLAALAALELAGHVRRQPGGRYLTTGPP